MQEKQILLALEYGLENTLTLQDLYNDKQKFISTQNKKVNEIYKKQIESIKKAIDLIKKAIELINSKNN